MLVPLLFTLFFYNKKEKMKKLLIFGLFVFIAFMAMSYVSAGQSIKLMLNSKTLKLVASTKTKYQSHKPKIKY